MILGKGKPTVLLAGSVLKTLKNYHGESLVEIIDFDHEANECMDYVRFYQRALEDIQNKME